MPSSGFVDVEEVVELKLMGGHGHLCRVGDDGAGCTRHPRDHQFIVERLKATTGRNPTQLTKPMKDLIELC